MQQIISYPDTYSTFNIGFCSQNKYVDELHAVFYGMLMVYVVITSNGLIIELGGSISNGVLIVLIVLNGG